MAKTTFLLLLLPLLLLAPSAAETKSFTIHSDTRPLILLEKFGFTAGGHVAITLSSVSVVSPFQQQPPPPDPSRLGFFLLSQDTFLQTGCPLGSPHVTTLFSFRDLSPPPKAAFNATFTVPTPNEYSLYFANCAPTTSVSMNLHTSLYNLHPPDPSKDFLSAGDTHLPAIFSLFAASYLLFLLLWIHLCRRAHTLSLHRIHFLMATLLIMKALNLFSAAEDKHYVKLTGTPHGWDVLFYTFQSSVPFCSSPSSS